MYHRMEGRLREVGKMESCEESCVDVVRELGVRAAERARELHMTRPRC